MKILITGGAGFIGSAVIRHLIANTEHHVVNVDKLTYAGNLESLKEIETDSRYQFEHVDICDAKQIERVFSEHKPDAVMHLAAESHVDRSIDGPAEFMHTNIIGTYILLEASRSYWNALDITRKTIFGFIMFQLMRSMVHWVMKACLRKKRLINQARLILQAKLRLIISCAPGMKPMTYP